MKRRNLNDFGINEGKIANDFVINLQHYNIQSYCKRRRNELCVLEPPFELLFWRNIRKFHLINDIIIDDTLIEFPFWMRVE